MAVAFITWLWGDKYDESHVAKLAAGVWRNYKQPHRFVVFSDRVLRLGPPIEVRQIADPVLTGRGCFCRLRMFDPLWQTEHGFDDRIVSLDLDMVMVAPFGNLFERTDSFMILKGVNAINPNPFNCSVMMLRSGEHAEVWQDFTLEKTSQIAFYEFPDDQGWIWHKLPKAAGWTGGVASGIYAFQKPGWPFWAGRALPPNARIVAFVGWRKPEEFKDMPWVRGALAGGMIDSGKVALFIPPGLKKFKLNLFESIGRTIGRVVRHDPKLLDDLPDDIVPICGCNPFLKPYYEKWKARGRNFIYWDRGYLRRVFATWLPKGSDMGIPGGYYRWHINMPQMDKIHDVPDDRWKFLRLQNELKPWHSGKHIVIADTLPDYWNLFSDPGWTQRTMALLKRFTDRPVILRDKESKVPLYDQLKDAHCLVAHGSIAAVEAVVMGCPVFVEPISAAALMGKTDISQIESPVYPERAKWLHSLAYCQYNERELVDGTLWRLIR